MLVCSVLRISLLDNEVSSRCLPYIPAAILIYHRCTPTWRFRNGFCKFRRISEFWETHRPKTWRPVLYSYHNFWAFSTRRFSTYLLRDSENDLFGKSRKRRSELHTVKQIQESWIIVRFQVTGRFEKSRFRKLRVHWRMNAKTYRRPFW